MQLDTLMKGVILFILTFNQNQVFSYKVRLKRMTTRCASISTVQSARAHSHFPGNYFKNTKALIWLSFRFLPHFENRWKIPKPWFDWVSDFYPILKIAAKYQSLDLIEFEILTRFWKSLKSTKALIWLSLRFLPDFENRVKNGQFVHRESKL